jgi:hypothetical protein
MCFPSVIDAPSSRLPVGKYRFMISMNLLFVLAVVLCQLLLSARADHDDELERFRAYQRTYEAHKTDISKTRTADIGINFWHVDILISNKSSFHAL